MTSESVGSEYVGVVDSIRQHIIIRQLTSASVGSEYVGVLDPATSADVCRRMLTYIYADVC